MRIVVTWIKVNSKYKIDVWLWKLHKSTVWYSGVLNCCTPLTLTTVVYISIMLASGWICFHYDQSIYKTFIYTLIYISFYSTKNIISKFSKLLCGHFRRSDKVDQNTINHCHCHGSCKLVIGLMANGFTFFLHLVFRYWQKFHSYGIRMIRRRPLSIYSLYPCPCPALRTGIWKLEIYIWLKQVE